MEFFVIKNKEDLYYDFSKGEYGNYTPNLNAGCFLPTKEIAEQMREEKTCCDDDICSVVIHSYDCETGTMVFSEA